MILLAVLPAGQAQAGVVVTTMTRMRRRKIKPDPQIPARLLGPDRDPVVPAREAAAVGILVAGILVVVAAAAAGRT